MGTKWMTQWKQYVGYNPCDQAYTGLESAHPGPVDNSDLFEGMYRYGYHVYVIPL